MFDLHRRAEFLVAPDYDIAILRFEFYGTALAVQLLRRHQGRTATAERFKHGIPFVAAVVDEFGTKGYRLHCRMIGGLGRLIVENDRSRLLEQFIDKVHKVGFAHFPCI